MAVQANIHEAKTHFSELLERAHRGEEVIIAKAGKPYARLVPIVEGGQRARGAFRGRISGDVLGGGRTRRLRLGMKSADSRTSWSR